MAGERLVHRHRHDHEDQSDCSNVKVLPNSRTGGDSYDSQNDKIALSSSDWETVPIIAEGHVRKPDARLSKRAPPSKEIIFTCGPPNCDAARPGCPLA